MKIKIGATSNDCEFFDDNGNLLTDIHAETLTVEIKPPYPSLTKVTMTILVKEVEVQVPDANVVTTAKTKP